jgi:hypothetical protein
MIEQLVNLVQNDRRRLPFLQKRIDMIPRTPGTCGTPENIKMRTSGLIRFIVATTSSPLLSGMR